MSSEGLVVSQDLEEIFALYAPHEWDNPLPVLSAESATAFARHIDQANLYSVAGMLSVEGTWGTHHARSFRTMSRLATQYTVAPRPGPYFLAGQYYKQGIAIWAPRLPDPTEPIINYYGT